MDPANNPGAPRYPIGVITRRTGLSADVLRVWERRYAVVTPQRSAGGQRLYSSDDLERLSLLRRVVEGGHRIASVAGLPLPELERLAAEITHVPPVRRQMDGSAASVREDALATVESLDGMKLESLLKRSAMSMSTGVWIDEVVGPFLTEIGDRWHAGQISPAHEHLASAITREVLGWVMRTFEPAAAASTIVVATLPGELHELGAMMAAVTAAELGWVVKYLGPDLPVEAVAAAARQVNARAIAISIVFSEKAADAMDELLHLRRSVAEDVAIVVGGAGARRHAEALVASGLTYVDGGDELRTWLSTITPDDA